MEAIITDRLTRSFDNRVAVDNLTLASPAGSVFGFLGPNGAGKTTTLRMLTALIAVSPRVFAAIISPGWLIVFGLCSPLLSFISIALIVTVPSRVNEPGTAQQLFAIYVVPLMAVFSASSPV